MTYKSETKQRLRIVIPLPHLTLSASTRQSRNQKDSTVAQFLWQIARHLHTYITFFEFKNPSLCPTSTFLSRPLARRHAHAPTSWWSNAYHQFTNSSIMASPFSFIHISPLPFDLDNDSGQVLTKRCRSGL